MNTTESFRGLQCRGCGDLFDVEVPGRCPECGGLLDPQYDYDALDVDRKSVGAGEWESMWRFEQLLPFPGAVAVSLGEGGTPAVECPSLAESLGVERVIIKDEGRNPTGTFKDRGHTVAVSAAVQHAASDIALASAGNAGQSAAAYAARAGLDAHVYLPSRAGFTQKAMVNVHGADLTVVEGRLPDASSAFEAALAEHADWYPTSTFVSPYRHEGKKTMFYELIEQLDWEVPDAIFYPTGGGVGLIGMHKAALEYQELGLIDDVPGMYAAQSTGCAPVVEAWETGAETVAPWADPDTICGGIEVPSVGAGDWVLDVLEESNGGAVATSDDEILEAATVVAQREGLEMGATCAAAASGAWAKARDGAFDADATIVILNTGTGLKDADLLRSHLMGRGQ